MKTTILLAVLLSACVARSPGKKGDWTINSINGRKYVFANPDGLSGIMKVNDSIVTMKMIENGQVTEFPTVYVNAEGVGTVGDPHNVKIVISPHGQLLKLAMDGPSWRRVFECIPLSTLYTLQELWR